jgi:hypothetical protein
MRISRFGKRFLRLGLFAILATGGLWVLSSPAETAQKIITPVERPPMFVLASRYREVSAFADLGDAAGSGE